MITLETERLVLRMFRESDLDAYAEMCADPEVMRYLDPVPDRDAAFRGFCAGVGHWSVRGYGFWVLEEIDSGQPLGRAGLVRWEGRRDVEVGYALRRTAWGKGYATEASRVALRYAHEVVGARGVVSVIDPANAASIRVAERLGAGFDRAESIKGFLLHVYRYPDPEPRPG